MKNQIKFVIIVSVVGLFFVLTNALAADLRLLKLNIPVGDLTQLDAPIVGECSSSLNPDKECLQIPWIAQYIGAWFKYGVVIGSMFAVLMIIVGGVMYVLAGASSSLVGKAKTLMWSSVFGLVILVGSYLILSAVNPALTNLPVIEVERLKQAVIDVAGKTDKFCEELDQSVYKINGLTANTQCGQEFMAESIAASTLGTKESLKCFSNKCPDGKNCALFDGKHACFRAVIWGNISYSYNRYVDYVWLYGVEHNDLDVIAKIDLAKGAKGYLFPYTAELAEDLAKYQSIILKVEINNSGGQMASSISDHENATILESLKTMASFRITPSNDDEYYVGRGDLNRYILGPNHFQGVWANYCTYLRNTADETKIFEGLLPENKKRDLRVGSDWYPVFGGASAFPVSTILNGDGIQVDIDSEYFMEDITWECPLNYGSRTLPVINNGKCLKSELGIEKDGLRCILSGDNNYAWTDRQENSYCANGHAEASGFNVGEKSCLVGECRYLQGKSSECQNNVIPCTGYCISKLISVVGDYCNDALPCSIDKNGNQLYCNDGANTCESGGWGSWCNDDSTCAQAKGFACITVIHRCGALSAKEYQMCDPNKKNACVNGLTCRKIKYSQDANKCKYPATNKETSRFYCADDNSYVCLCGINYDGCGTNEFCSYFSGICSKKIPGAQCDGGRPIYGDKNNELGCNGITSSIGLTFSNKLGPYAK